MRERAPAPAPTSDDAFLRRWRDLASHPTFRRARRHILDDLLRRTRPRPFWNVLSLGCGAGDLERALARHVRHVVALDLSAEAVRIGGREARRDGAALRDGAARIDFVRADALAAPVRGPFDMVATVGLLHGLPDGALRTLARGAFGWLRPGGLLYTHDPSYRRLVGYGKALFRGEYDATHAAGERELDARWLAHELRLVGFEPVTVGWCDFLANPWAWLFPRTPYPAFEALLALDRALVRLPGLRQLSSSFTIVAVRP